jgi:hypothetical protein
VPGLSAVAVLALTHLRRRWTTLIALGLLAGAQVGDLQLLFR